MLGPDGAKSPGGALGPGLWRGSPQIELGGGGRVRSAGPADRIGRSRSPGVSARADCGARGSLGGTPAGGRVISVAGSAAHELVGWPLSVSVIANTYCSSRRRQTDTLESIHDVRRTKFKDSAQFTPISTTAVVIAQW